MNIKKIRARSKKIIGGRTLENLYDIFDIFDLNINNTILKSKYEQLLDFKNNFVSEPELFVEMLNSIENIDNFAETVLHKISYIKMNDEELQELQNTNKTNYLVEILNLLLNNGADQFIVDSEGYYPIHIAVKENNYLVAKTLIDYGANILLNIKNYDNDDEEEIYMDSLIDENTSLEMIDLLVENDIYLYDHRMIQDIIKKNTQQNSHKISNKIEEKEKIKHQIFFKIYFLSRTFDINIFSNNDSDDSIQFEQRNISEINISEINDRTKQFIEIYKNDIIVFHLNFSDKSNLKRRVSKLFHIKDDKANENIQYPFFQKNNSFITFKANKSGSYSCLLNNNLVYTIIVKDYENIFKDKERSNFKTTLYSEYVLNIKKSNLKPEIYEHFENFLTYEIDLELFEKLYKELNEDLLNSRNIYGRSILHILCCCNPNKDNNNKLIHLIKNCIQKKHLKLFYFQRDGDDLSPIHYLIKFNNIQILKVIIHHSQQDIVTVRKRNTFNNNFETLLDFAILNGSVECAVELINNGLTFSYQVYSEGYVYDFKDFFKQKIEYNIRNILDFLLYFRREKLTESHDKKGSNESDDEEIEGFLSKKRNDKNGDEDKLLNHLKFNFEIPDNHQFFQKLSLENPLFYIFNVFIFDLKSIQDVELLSDNYKNSKLNHAESSFISDILNKYQKKIATILFEFNNIKSQVNMLFTYPSANHQDIFEKSTGLIDLVKHRILNKLVFSLRDENGNTILHKCLLNKNFEMLKFLLNQCIVFREFKYKVNKKNQTIYDILDFNYNLETDISMKSNIKNLFKAKSSKDNLEIFHSTFQSNPNLKRSLRSLSDVPKIGKRIRTNSPILGILNTGRPEVNIGKYLDSPVSPRNGGKRIRKSCKKLNKKFNIKFNKKQNKNV